MERPAELPVDQKDQVGHRENTRNVVIFGESGVGKSSLINMIAGHEVAKTSSSGMGCTFQSSRYRMPITGEMFHVWDTAGLDEGIYGRVPAEMAERYLAKKLVRDLWPINPGSSRAGYAPNSEVHLRSPAEGNGLPYKDLTAAVKRRKDYASRYGAFGDIWECDLTIRETPRMVAVKAVRARRTQGNTEDLDAQKKKLHRELKVWAKLQHRNVVQLLGVVSGFGPLPSMVSPWFDNGSLSNYLARHGAMDLSDRQGLLCDIATGLRYLHSQGVVHGDLHSDNVLVDDNGRACLTDFGLSLIIRDFVGTSYLKSSVCGAVRYADPELVRQANNEGNTSVVYPTEPSDMYSFGSLMLHVLSGKKPYEGVRDIFLVAKILNGKRPSLPTNDKRIPPGDKSLIKRCWSREKSMRPSANEITTLLHSR